MRQHKKGVIKYTILVTLSAEKLKNSKKEEIECLLSGNWSRESAMFSYKLEFVKKFEHNSHICST